MKKSIYIIILVLPFIIYQSCDDIIEEDISLEKVEILAPYNNSILKDQNITFWWNKIEGADQYNIQIVKPSFDSVQFLISDTLIVEDKLYFNMVHGVYQWRVKAINSIGSTEYTQFSFQVDTSEVKR